MHIRISLKAHMLLLFRSHNVDFFIPTGELVFNFCFNLIFGTLNNAGLVQFQSSSIGNN